MVRSIASEEGISIDELDQIDGSGKDGRVTKTDLLNYISNNGSAKMASQANKKVESPRLKTPSATTPPSPESEHEWAIRNNRNG